MIRAIVKTCIEGVIKRFSATGRPGESIENREYVQHYGYTSRPKPGAEVIVIREGNHYLAIASDDRRYRLALEEGEAALYDDLGQRVHLTREGVEVQSLARVRVTAPVVEAVASERVTLTTPLCEISGNLVVGGDITAGGNISDVAGAKSMAGMRSTYDNHTHPQTAGGVTLAPGQEM